MATPTSSPDSRSRRNAAIAWEHTVSSPLLDIQPKKRNGSPGPWTATVTQAHRLTPLLPHLPCLYVVLACLPAEGPDVARKRQRGTAAAPKLQQDLPAFDSAYVWINEPIDHVSFDVSGKRAPSVLNPLEYCAAYTGSGKHKMA